MRHVRSMVVIMSGWALLAVLGLPGCGSGSGSPHPVEPEQALQTLRDVLESWKQGQLPQSWKEQAPRVIVQDSDWEAGYRLEDDDILAPGQPVDANLHCEVRLTLVAPDGSETERTVTYLVETSPVPTVFRRVMP